MNIERALERRLKAYRFRLRKVERRINFLATFRFAVAVIIIFGAIASFDKLYTIPGLAIAFVASLAFLYLMVLHDRCYRFKERLLLVEAMLMDDLARATWRFRDLKNPSAISFAPDHPFAHDLDLAGPFSLLKLLDNSFHVKAHGLIKGWIDRADPVAAIRARQEAVADLTERRRFRQQLALACRLHSTPELDGDMLRDWLEVPVPWSLRLPAYLFGRLTALITTSVVVMHFFLGIQMPWLLVVVAQGVVFFGLEQVHKRFAMGFMHRGKLIVATCAALRTIEQSPFQAQILKELKAGMQVNGTKAGKSLAKVIALHEQLSYRANGFAHLFLNIFFLWDQHHLRRLADWRDRYGRHVPEWIDFVFQIEALSALGNYRQLFPGWPFPQLREGEEILLDAVALGHPAISSKVRVGNDYRLASNGKLDLVTGSNMSGKSTFLRTVGTNLVLARMGAPVCAQQMTCSLPHLWTSIHIQDSLEQGVSYFYAEVRRIKAILDQIASDEAPVFYLMDEILKGTNSRERLIASKAMVHFLLDHRASGLITTHDLEMLAIVRERPDAITNYHFQERVEGDEMFFDYRLKNGELTSTNALRVMRGAGVPLVFEE